MALNHFLTKVQINTLFKILKEGSDGFLKSVAKKWQIIGHEEIGWIVKNEMSGRPGIKRVSGNAARALTPKTTIEGVNVKHEWIAGGPAAKYLWIHQYGKTILPKAGAYLTFQIKAGVYASSLKTKQVKKVKTLTNWVKVKSVTIPKRLHILERFENPGHELRIKAVVEAMEEIQNGSK